MHRKNRRRSEDEKDRVDQPLPRSPVPRQCAVGEPETLLTPAVRLDCRHGWSADEDVRSRGKELVREGNHHRLADRCHLEHVVGRPKRWNNQRTSLHGNRAVSPTVSTPWIVINLDAFYPAT